MNEQRTPCCILHGDYPMGADACGETRDRDGKTFRCTRPVDHDGGHVACGGVADDGEHEHTEVWF